MRNYRVTVGSAEPHANICTSLQTGNHISTTSLNFLRARCQAAQPTASKHWRLDKYALGKCTLKLHVHGECQNPFKKPFTVLIKLEYGNFICRGYISETDVKFHSHHVRKSYADPTMKTKPKCNPTNFNSKTTEIHLSSTSKFQKLSQWCHVSKCTVHLGLKHRALTWVTPVLRRILNTIDFYLANAILMTVMCYSHSTDGATSTKKVQRSNLSN